MSSPPIIHYNKLFKIKELIVIHFILENIQWPKTDRAKKAPPGQKCELTRVYRRLPILSGVPPVWWTLPGYVPSIGGSAMSNQRYSPKFKAFWTLGTPSTPVSLSLK